MVSLVIGSLLYLLARPANLLVFGWIGSLGLSGPLMRLRETLAPLARALPAWVLFSLPNALWAYAFTVAMSHMWSHKLSRASLPWLAVGPVISIGAELGQGIGLVPGTFDLVDLLTVVIACVAALRRVRLDGLGRGGA
ncbi:MAG: hypothetical protein QM702_20990 [Rubrivivax sp.]